MHHLSRVPLCMLPSFPYLASPHPAPPHAVDGTGLLVTVSGSVKYGSAGSKTTPHLISHQFVLVDDPAKPGTYFIASDCLRFV